MDLRQQDKIKTRQDQLISISQLILILACLSHPQIIITIMIIQLKATVVTQLIGNLEVGYNYSAIDKLVIKALQEN